MLATFDLSIVYVPGSNSTVDDCLSHWACQARKTGIDISMPGDAEETGKANRIIESDSLLE